MLTCKQVSKALARADYENLPALKKFFLKLHIKLCFICGRFNRQMMDTQDMCRQYRQKEDKDEISPFRSKLDPDKVEELKTMLAMEAARTERPADGEAEIGGQK